MKRILRTFSFACTLLLFLQAGAQGNHALIFDGTDDKVDCGNDTTLRITGTQITLEAWIYPTFFPKNVYEGNLINKEYNTSNYGFMFRVGDQGRLNFAIGDGSWHELTSSGYVLSLNTWQHVAATYNGSMMRIYVNGVPVDSMSETSSIYNAIGTPLLLGAHTTYTRFFQGMMDEVRIWGRCLSTSEIYNNMGRELCTRPSGLRAYYKFNQGKPSQSNTNVKKLNDLGPYKNHGTLSNFALTGSSSNWVAGQTYLKDVVNVSDTVVACARYTSPSRRYSWVKSGIYYDTIPTVVMACDSAITVHLTINKVSSAQIKVHACSSYTSPSGKYTWTKGGVYTDNLKNYLNCDSIITITLTVGGGRDSIYPDVCNSYRSPAGKTYTLSGYYTDTLPNYRNCDSIVDIFLTVRKSTQATIQRSVCSGLLSPGGKHLWTVSGTYYDTIPNRKGCDSLITIQLKVLKSASVLNADVCNSMRSPGGEYLWTSSGTYHDTIPNYAFCDSVITVNLKVRKSSASTQNINACRTYLHIRNGRRYTQSGIIRDTLRNAAGCDSVITWNIAVQTFNTDVVQNGAVLTSSSSTGNWQWLDCSAGMSVIPNATQKVYTATKNGSYAVELRNGNCSDTSVCFAVTGLSLNAPGSGTRVIFYPNPGQGDLYMMSSELLQDVKISIMDATGRCVFDTLIGNTEGNLFLTRLTPGVYVVEYSDAAANGTTKNILIVR